MKPELAFAHRIPIFANGTSFDMLLSMFSSLFGGVFLAILDMHLIYLLLSTRFLVFRRIR